MKKRLFFKKTIRGEMNIKKRKDSGDDLDVENKEVETSLIHRILPNIFSFAFGLGITYFFGWKTDDLVWGIWLCSLLINTIVIFSVLGLFADFILSIVKAKKKVEKQQLSVVFLVVTIILVPLLLVAPFAVSVPLCFSGVFLSEFCPVENVSFEGFDMMTPLPVLFGVAFKGLIKPYGLFLVPVFIAERKLVCAPVKMLFKFIKAIRSSDIPKGEIYKPIESAIPCVSILFFLSFFLGFCHIHKIDSVLIYIVVYTACFFPWDEVKKQKEKLNRRKK